MKSKPVKVCEKLFRYDYDAAVVEYIYKMSAEEIAEEKEWIAKHGRPLLGCDEDGYTVVQTVGLRRENWKNVAARNEYLSEWAAELGAEENRLMTDFIKYELPYYQKEACNA